MAQENAWYIIPEEKTWGNDCITLYPKSPKSKYEIYREAWDQLDPGPNPTVGRIDSIQGCAEEFPEWWIQ